MALLIATLKAELLDLLPTENPATANARLGTAYRQYMRQAMGLTPIINAGLATPRAQMIAAMTFTQPATPAQGAAVLVAGLTAFWAGMVAAPVACFTGATLITPPTFAALPAALAAVMAANVAAGLSLDDSAQAIATAIHTATLLVPTVTTNPGAVVTPIV